MDFREYEVIREGDEIVIVGTIRDPINWDFSIRMCEDDLAGIVKVALQRPTLALVIRSLFKRFKRHHWTQERQEHLDEGKRRRVTAREKGQARVRAAEETREELLDAATRGARA